MKKGARAAPVPQRPLARVVLIACALLAIGFAAAWLYLQHAERQRLSSSYTALKRVAISRDGHSIAATIAIKTSDADRRWATQSRPALEAAFQQALLHVEPQQALAPGGLQAFQQGLDEALNRALATDKVQQVVITDFLVSEGDY